MCAVRASIADQIPQASGSWIRTSGQAASHRWRIFQAREFPRPGTSPGIRKPSVGRKCSLYDHGKSAMTLKSAASGSGAEFALLVGHRPFGPGRRLTFGRELARSRTQLAGRSAEVGFELPAELGLTAEPPTIGDLRDGFLVTRTLQIVASGLEPQSPDPLADGGAAFFEQVVQITHGHAVRARDLFDRHRMLRQISANVMFDACEGGEPHGAHLAADGSRVLLDRQAKQIEQAAA